MNDPLKTDKFVIDEITLEYLLKKIGDKIDIGSIGEKIQFPISRKSLDFYTIGKSPEISSELITVDLYDKSKIITGSAVAGEDGAFVRPGNQWTNTYYMELPSDKCKILGGEIAARDKFTICFYDENMIFMPPSIEWLTYTFPLIPHPGSKYMATTLLTVDIDKFEMKVEYESVKEIGSFKYLDNDLVIMKSQIMDLNDELPIPEVSNIWKGKKMAVLGDSLTQGEGFISWHNILKDELEFSQVYNHGLGWSIVGQNTTAHYNPNSVVTDERKPMILRAPLMEDDADLVVFLCGTGEIIDNLPIGTINDPEVNGDGLTLTFYAGIKRLSKILTDKYPHAKIIAMTTLQIRSKSSLAEEQIKAIKEICPRYGITVCDTSKARLNLTTMSSSQVSAVSTDGLHLTNDGHKRLAACLKNSILYE